MTSEINLAEAKDFVTAVYRGVLKRDPEPAGLATFTKTLQDGTYSKDQLISAFLQSDEYRALTNPPFGSIPTTENVPDGCIQLIDSPARLVEELLPRICEIVQQKSSQDMAGEQLFFRHVKQSDTARQPYLILLPDLAITAPLDGPYMDAANCLARDFFHQKFATFCKSIAHPFILHRKLWEFAFVTKHLRAGGALRSGKKGVGFGVGNERLPSLFASLGCQILATDAPPGVADAGWQETNQYAASCDQLFFPEIVDRAIFDERVRFGFADMNAIDDNIRDYDFCWSSCCYEHLGSIEKGLEFVVESVEKTLKVGGVACHTSELNLTSNDRTIETGGTVLFRRRDIETLIERLEQRGHRVKRLPIEPQLSFIDFLVDVPPYVGDVHLKLQLGEFVSTSFGIVVTRGR